MTRRLLRVAAIALIGGAALGAWAAAPAPARADEASDALWYFDQFDVAAAQSAGVTGAGVKIAVIDAQIYPDAPPLAGVPLTVSDSVLCRDRSGALIPPVASEYNVSTGHGTGVVSLILGTGKSGAQGGAGVGTRGVAPQASVTFYSYGMEEMNASGDGHRTFCFDESGKETSVLGAQIRQAVADGARIISISQSGPRDAAMGDAIAEAVRKGVVVLGALPNKSRQASGIYPASANGVVAVQRMGADGAVPSEAPSVPKTTVVGPGDDILQPGGQTAGWAGRSTADGTSAATPIIAGFLADVLQKYPTATGPQLIQSLIRNTSLDDHELSHDDRTGYGIVSLTHLLREDPTQYPDVNPLIVDDADAWPAASAISGSGAGSDPGSGSSSATPVPAASGSLLVPIVVGVVIALVVIAGVVVLIVVLVRRGGRPPRGPSGGPGVQPPTGYATAPPGPMPPHGGASMSPPPAGGPVPPPRGGSF